MSSVDRGRDATSPRRRGQSRKRRCAHRLAYLFVAVSVSLAAVPASAQAATSAHGDFESDVSGWKFWNGSSMLTPTRVTSDAAPGGGTASAEVSSSFPTGHGYVSYFPADDSRRIPAEAGDVVYASGAGKVASADGQLSVTVRVRFRDPSNKVLATETVYNKDDPDTGDWIEGGGFSRPAPANTATAETILSFWLPWRGATYTVRADKLAIADVAPQGPVSDPVVVAVGDIACDPASGSFNGGLGTSSACRQESTADLAEQLGPDAVLMLGDAQYEESYLDKFARSYEPSWGRFKQKTWATFGGSHDFYGGGDFYEYFGSRAGPAASSAFSFDIGQWHLVSLPSGSSCSHVGGCGAGSRWHTWLRNDLAANQKKCTLAMWHYPRWSSGYHGSDTSTSAFVDLLYAHDADLILVSHDHNYERFAPQNPSGQRDDARGIRQIVVGTGGKSLRPMETPIANSVVRDASTYGVLKLSLHDQSYDYEFVPEPGKTFTDQGSADCH